MKMQKAMAKLMGLDLTILSPPQCSDRSKLGSLKMFEVTRKGS